MDNKISSKKQVSDLIPYYSGENETYVFLQKRGVDVKYQPGWFGLFGGKSKNEETPEKVVVREIKEELSIDISDHTHFCHYEFYDAFVDTFIMNVTKDFQDIIDIKEGQYGKFFTEKEMYEEKMLSLRSKIILQDFFNKMKQSNISI